MRFILNICEKIEYKMLAFDVMHHLFMNSLKEIYKNDANDVFQKKALYKSLLTIWQTFFRNFFMHQS